MNYILTTVFGSHLYGLQTSNSDTDYKSIYLPTARDIVLNNIRSTVKISSGPAHQKNSADDVDHTAYSLDKFIKLACDGDAVALDMLHSKENLVIDKTGIWEYIQNNRTKFYSKDMKSYAGYVKKQCAKYGIKGSKIHELENLVDILENTNCSERLKTLTLPSGIHCFYTQKMNHATSILEDFYSVNNKLISLNCKLIDVLVTVKKQLSLYGERAKLARENQNIDWKAVSHALRVSYQLQDIYEFGDFEYPLKQSQFLIDVKKGNLDYAMVSDALEQVTERVYQLSQQSDFPETVEVDYWDDFVYNVYKSIILDQ